MAQHTAPQQYYVAVGSRESKLKTLVDLLRALEGQRQGQLAVAITCSSRDSLESTVFSLVEVRFYHIQAPSERLSYALPCHS